MELRPTHACVHLAADPELDYTLWFTGEGRDCWWVCADCAAARPASPDLVACDDALFALLEENACWDGMVGHPGLVTRDAGLRFEHTDVAVPTTGWIGLHPAANATWWVLLADGGLHRFDPRAGRLVRVVDLQGVEIELDAQTDIRVSPCEAFIAVYGVSRQHGSVHTIATGARTLRLDRGDYRPENSCFPVAFFRWDDRTFLVAGTAWNRLDLFDPATGALLSGRVLDAESELNYFHGSLAVSPDGRWLADAGWVWAPVGMIELWRLDRWLDHPLEAEQGGSRFRVAHRDYFWDGPMCWIGPDTLAYWGWGGDDEWLLPAVVLVDVRRRAERDWFPGPQCRAPSSRAPLQHRPSLVFDEWLFAIHAEIGVGVWDVETGEHLLQDATIAPVQYHPGIRQFISLSETGVTLSRLLDPAAS